MLESIRLGSFGAFLINFERACCFTELILNPPPKNSTPQGLLHDSCDRFKEALKGMLETTGSVTLSPPVIRLIERLVTRLNEDWEESQYAVIAEHARQTRQAMLDDLDQHCFVWVDSAHAELFDQPDPWGATVADKFPDAAKDIEAATRCLALREWTACVFHSMRVLGHGLQPIATRFQVPFAVASWHAVIQGIEDGIDALRNKHGLTAQDRADISFYSEAASEFRYFKDAWRNHVSHERGNYDDKDAPRVYNHVRDFMQHIAKGV
jgi:hypothetical protein